MLRTFDRAAGLLATLVVAGVFLLGTYAEFALPYYRGGPQPQGCYFGDALIIFIDCGQQVPAFVDPILTWSWYLTWGNFWLFSFFVPFAPTLGLPIVCAWAAAIFLSLRWGWRLVGRRTAAT